MSFFEDQPWYLCWQVAIERVAALQDARDSEQRGTPGWEAADAEYEAAVDAAYRLIASQFQQRGRLH